MKKKNRCHHLEHSYCVYRKNKYLIKDYTKLFRFILDLKTTTGRTDKLNYIISADIGKPLVGRPYQMDGRRVGPVDTRPTGC